jgi:hypothetical protein
MDDFNGEYDDLVDLYEQKKYTTVLRKIDIILSENNTDVSGGGALQMNEIQQLNDLRKEVATTQREKRRSQMRVAQVNYGDMTKSFRERASLINELFMDEEIFGKPDEHDEHVRVLLQTQLAEANELCEDTIWEESKLMMLISHAEWYLSNTATHLPNKTKDLRRTLTVAGSAIEHDKLKELMAQISALEAQTTGPGSLENAATLYEVDRKLVLDPNNADLRRQYAVLAFDSARSAFQNATGNDIDVFLRLTPERQVFTRHLSLEDAERFLAQAYIYLSPKERVNLDHISRYIPDDIRRLTNNPQRDDLDIQRMQLWRSLDEHTEKLLSLVMDIRKRLREIEEQVANPLSAYTITLPDLRDIFEIKKYTATRYCDDLLNKVGNLLYRRYEEQTIIWQWFHVDEIGTNTGELQDLEIGENEIQRILSFLPYDVDYRLSFERLLTLTLTIIHNFKNHAIKRKEVDMLYNNFLNSIGRIKEDYYKSLQSELTTMVYFERAKRDQIQIELDRYRRENTLMQPGELLKIIKSTQREVVHAEIARLRNIAPQAQFLRAHAEYQILLILKESMGLDERHLTSWDSLDTLLAEYEKQLYDLNNQILPVFHGYEEYVMIKDRIEKTIQTFRIIRAEHDRMSVDIDCYHRQFLNYLDGLVYASTEEKTRQRFRIFFIHQIWKRQNERARNDPTDPCHEQALLDYANFRPFFER